MSRLRALAGRPGQLAGTAWRGPVLVLAGAGLAPPWRSRGQRRATAAVAALGLVLVAFAVVYLAVGIWTNVYPPHPVAAIPPPVIGSGDLVQLGSVGAVLVAVRYPLLGWRIAYLVALLAPLVPGQPRGETLQVGVPLLILFCAAGLLNGRAATWSMWLLLLAPVWWWVHGWPKAALISVFITALAVAVDALGAQQRAQRALAVRARQAEAEQARRSVLEERARIARELHDVVAHHMSLLAVQAETAPYRLGELPEPVRAEFSALSAAARAALTDMRRLLGVLRTDEPAGHAPQPKLSEIGELIDAARGAGVPVEFAMDCAGIAVPPSLGVCVYRIVQEALSNASRHAPGASVSVRIQHADDVIRLEVANGEPSLAPPPPNGQEPGHGLLGMRERAALLGGALSAGPAPGGGFAVSAVLPLADSP